MGRTSQLTPHVQQKIVDGIRSGLHIHRAALRGGISEATFYRWMQQGATEPGDGDPDLDNMALKDLRKLATSNNVPFTGRTTAPKLREQLTAAGVESWDRYRQFREAIEAAELDLEQRMTLYWQQAIEPLMDMSDPQNPKMLKAPDHKAIATFMARRFPAGWSPTQNVQLTGANGGAVEISVATEEALARNVQAYLKGVDDSSSESKEVEA